MITQNVSAKYQSRKVTLSKGSAGSESDLGHLVMILATRHNLAMCSFAMCQESHRTPSCSAALPTFFNGITTIFKGKVKPGCFLFQDNDGIFKLQSFQTLCIFKR